MEIFFTRIPKFFSRPSLYTQGIATLPVVAALSLMVIVIIIGISTLSFNEGVVAQGAVRSSKALVYAETGARDALLRIARNKNYSCAAPSLPTGCYAIETATNGCATNEGCARVTVDTGINPKIILAEGRASGNKRMLKVSVTFDALSHGEIASVTWTEVAN